MVNMEETQSSNLKTQSQNSNLKAIDSEKKKSGRGLWWKIPAGIIGVIVVIGAIGGWQAWGFYRQALALQPAVEKVKGNLESQDLPALAVSLDELHRGGINLEEKYRAMGWMGWIPVAGSYFKDGDHGLKAGVAGVEAGQVLANAIEPYADVLGFKGSGTFAGGTAEDRVITILSTLDKITPRLDEVAEKLKIMDGNLQQINPNRYRFEVGGKNLAEEFAQIKEAIHGATEAVTNAKPALVELPKVAGMEGEKKYMVLFHNDGELRGTGGFMTAYAILRVDKGRVYAERSSDIYDLDAKFRSRLKPPEPIEKYLKNVPYWYLRDMNLAPDFKANMDQFTKYYGEVPGEPDVDGVIGVDTNFLVDILKILGPVDVPGFGRFTTDEDPRCKCPQVVYQLELIADRPAATLVASRKGVLGPLMKELLNKAYAAPTPWWDDLFKAIIDNGSQKHMVFYFLDGAAQQAAEKLNAAGRVVETRDDYFMIQDVNFGGAKANFFVTQEVVGELSIGGDGTITKTMTVTYTNPAPPSNCNLEAGQLCLNAGLPDYVRVYVPKGSQLVEALGLEEEPKVFEDNGKTVVEGFLKIHPQSSAKTVYKYKLPWKSGQAPGKLVIQKQVGADLPHYKIELPDRVEEFDLAGDREINVKW
jgi:hypothetical protein